MPHIYITSEKIIWKIIFSFTASILAYFQYKIYELKIIGFLDIDYSFLYTKKSDILVLLIFILININLLLVFKKFIIDKDYRINIFFIIAYLLGLYFSLSIETTIVTILVFLLLSYMYIEKKLIEYISITLFLSVVHIFLFNSISPFNGITVFDSMTGRIDAYQPIITNYIENIKLGSIFSNLNQKSSFGSEVYYPLSSSYFYEIISIFKDLFTIELDYISLYENIKIYTFTSFLFCSIGTYFLIRNQFNINRFISLLAALIVIYGNSAFIGYQGNENYHQFAEYVVFPWALIALFHGINNKRYIYIYVSGFVLGASLLIMRSSFEFRFISVMFIGLTLVLANFNSIVIQGTFNKCKNNIILIFILATGYLSSAMIDIMPLAGGILSGDLSIFQPHKFNGFNWREGFLNLNAILFEYPIEKSYNFFPNDVGRNSGLYKGPIFSLFIISSILYLIVNFKKIFTDKKPYIAYILVLVIIFLSIFNGENSLLSFLSKNFGFGRVNFPSRIIVFYNLFLLFLFIFILNKILYVKNSLKYIFSGCFLYTVLLLTVIDLNEVKNYDFQLSLNLIILILLILYKNLINFKFYLLFPITFIILLSIYKLNVGTSDLYVVGSSKLSSSSNEELCLKENLEGIRRYAINPLCQHQNKILNNIDDKYQRYLYVFNSQLPSINSHDNSKLVNVADSSVYSYGGSPIFPSNLGVAYLTELFPFSKNYMALEYNFDLNLLKSKNYRNFLDWLSIKYILIEKGPKISDSQIDYISQFYNNIYDDDRYSILQSRQASDFIYLSSIEESQRLDEISINYISQTKNFNLYKSQFQNQVFKYFLSEENYFSNKNLFKSDNGKYKSKDSNSENNRLDIVSFNGSKSLFNVTCVSKCMLIINNIFLNEYSAVSANEKFEIIPVNYGRIGIVIPHEFTGEILMEYENIYKIYGVLFFLACIFLILILL
jgi:hypothetical protein